MKKLKIIVKGFVQGVGFRYYVYRNAQSLGLLGYVKNLATGAVEIFLEGEEQKIEEMISIVKQGPSRSRVNSIDLEYGDFNENFFDFSIR